MKRITIIILALLVLGAVALGGAYWVVAKQGAVKEERVLYLREATDYAEVHAQLDGALKHPHLFNLAVKVLGMSDRVRAGRYEIKPGMTIRQVRNILRNGLQTPVKLTLNNVRTLPQLAGKLGAQLATDSLTWLAYLTDPAMAAYNITPEQVIGLFLPNTYEVYWTVQPADLVERMHREWLRFWNDDRQAKLQAIHLTPMEATTLASIVYEESRFADEYPVIAGVYLNRLRLGMKLQACPTAKYAVGDFTLRRILNRHINYPSPYNTYLNEGLPPGPICMPSVAAIDAVLNYQHHSYLFFAAAPDYSGRNVFAVTGAEHERNSVRYHQFLDREGIKK